MPSSMSGCVIGLVAGLCITRLLSGLARFVQHPSRTADLSDPLGWAIYLLLAVMHFWWFEFGLGRGPVLGLRALSLRGGYASLFFFTGTLLFPDRMDDHHGFADYFPLAAGVVLRVLAAIFLADIVDTAPKGPSIFAALGAPYPVRQVVLAMLALVAHAGAGPRFHAAFPALALAIEVWSILGQFYILRAEASAWEGQAMSEKPGRQDSWASA